MKLSRQCEVAIDILVFCAKKPDEIVRTSEAAEFANTTRNHAHQVVVQLVRAGLLEGIRGQQGGIRLGRRASHIVVGEVVKLMERSLEPVETAIRSGVFSALVKQAAQAAFDTFDAFTIGDLAEQGPRAGLACLTCEVRAHFHSPRRQWKKDFADEAAISS